jgi:hypothetical protein
LVKTEEKYTDLSTSLRLSSVYIIYGIFPHKSIVRNEKNNKQTLKTTFKRAECVFFNHLAAPQKVDTERWKTDGK